MAQIRDQAVVLSRLDYSETSQVLVLMTREHGKVRAIAKGIRRSTKKRFAVGIDLLEVGTMVATMRDDGTGNLANISEWTQNASLGGLRDELFRLNGALYVAELTTQLTADHDPHPELFDALIAVLNALVEASEPIGPVVWFQFRMLVAIGSLPRFDACVRCENPDDLTHFSSREGGMICRSCVPSTMETRPVTRATIASLQARGPSLSRPGDVPHAGSPEITDTRQPDNVGDAPPDQGRATATAPSSPGGQAPADSPGDPAAGPSPFTGPFRLLDYHISHLMGRQPRLAAKIVPSIRRPSG